MGEPQRFRVQVGVCAAALLVCTAAAQIAPSGTPSASSLPSVPAPSQTSALPSAPQPTPTVLRGLTIQQPAPGPLPLGFDEAIERSLQHNFQLYLDQQDEANVRGQVLSVASNLLPTLEATAQTNAQEINLAAMGFKPSSFPKSLRTAPISSIVKVKTTSAQLNLSQVLFNAQAYEFYRAAQGDVTVAALNTLQTRGNVVMTAGTQYLQALADQAYIEDAAALLKADQEILRQATERHNAGVGINLDVLRARVQAQAQQQVLVGAETQFARQKIALDRTLALPAGQDLTLTDAVLFAEFEAMPLDQARTLAYTRRKDYLALLARTEVAQRTAKAIRFGRLPTLGVGGFYGVLGETRGLYHGVFAAQGELLIPVFQEAAFRGEREVAEARISRLRLQAEDLRVGIDAQIRAAMLDVDSSRALVKVARSSVDLATQQLADTRDRYAAGVDDLLPVVQAQALFAAAQSRLVETTFEYNRAKLNLALQTGVLESQYRSFLGR